MYAHRILSNLKNDQLSQSDENHFLLCARKRNMACGSLSISDWAKFSVFSDRNSLVEKREVGEKPRRLLSTQEDE